MKKSLLSIAVSTFTISGLTGFASPASAQTAEEIVITARKRDESLAEVPVTVTVFTAQDIEASGIETPSDFIGLTPNVTLVQTQNAGNAFVTARGISQNRNSEMSVAVLVDGVLMVNPAQFNQELYDIQQIEFLKGPQGALYGRNAIGGAITITTKAPSDTLEGRILLGADSGPGWRAQGTLSGPLNDSGTLKYRASLSAKDTDGFIDNPYLGEEADPYKDISGRLRLLYEPSNTFTADLRLSRSELETQGFYYNIRDSANDPDSVNDTSLDVRVNNAGLNNRDLTNVSLKMDWDWDIGTLTSVTSYDGLTELITGDAFDFLPIAESIGVAFGGTDLNQSQYLEVHSRSQELRFTSPADQQLRWITGAYAVSTNRYISTGNMIDTGNGVTPIHRTPNGRFPGDTSVAPLNPQVTFLADKQDNFAWAVFGEVAYDIRDNLEASFSLRYDRDTRENTTRTPQAFLPNPPGYPQGAFGEVREETWDDWQPKFTLRWQSSENMNWYGSLSRGFRSGGFNQTGVGAVAGASGFLGVGDTFDQETVNTIEGGFKGSFLDGRLQANAALFHSKAKGTYFFIFLVDNSTQNLGNLKEAEYTGLEIDLAANINPYLDINLALGYTDSEVTASDTPADIGNEAPNVSEYTFNFGPHFHYPLPWGNGLEGFARAEYQVIGDTYFFDRFQAGNNVRDPVHLLDLRVGVEVPNEWTVTLWAKNALDEEYNAEYSSGGFVFKAPPRQWGLDFVRRF